MRRMIFGALAASLVLIIPALGNPAILGAAHLWILLGIAVAASQLQPGYNPIGIMFSTGDRGTGAQIIWSIYLVQLAATLEAAYLRYPESVAWNAVAYAALTGCAIGLAIRTWAVMTLGRLFTMHISIQQDHVVVTDGPYRWVRHPSYLGALVLYLSAVTLVHAWYALLGGLLVLPFAFLRRIRFEESRLLGEFGGKYAAYQRRTWKLVPYVL